MFMNLRALFAGAAVVAALALGGCGGGGGDDHPSSTAASAGTTGTDTSQAQTQQERTEDSNAGTSKDSFTLGSPADVPRSEGGDNSVQDFGSEASEADRAAAGRTLAAYYDALAKGDTDEACTLLASRTRQSIEQTLKRLPTQGNGGSLPTTCPQILKLTGNAGAAQLHLSELLSLRQQDDNAFLIYRAGDGKVYAMPMTEEDGGWKVAGVAAAAVAA